MKKEENRNMSGRAGIYIFLAANKRLLAYGFAFGVPFAASFVLGWRLKAEGTVFRGGTSIPAMAGNLLLFLLEVLALSLPAAVCAMPFLRGAAGEWKRQKDRKEKPQAGERQRERAADETGQGTRPLWQVWLFYMAVIFLCWLPVFLAYYPSVFAYDAEGQLYQVIANDYSTHHPLLHTLFLGAFFRLGGALGSYSAGMAVHSAAQMFLMAGAFAGALSYLYRKNTARWTRILLLFFFAVFPANSVLAISTTKDVLFAALVLLDTLCFYELVCGRNMRGTKRLWAAYIVVGAFMLLFRNNAVYAFVVSMPILLIGIGKMEIDQDGRCESGKEAGRIYLFLSVGILLLFAAGAFSLKMFTHAQSGSPREMLSVPLQQMARTRVEAEEEIEPALRQELEKYIPAEWVFAAYDPHLADPVKNRAVIHDDPKGLIKSWIRLGTEHPAIYVDAFLDNCVGLWFLQDTSHAQVYGIGTESGFGYLSTDNRTMPAGCEIVEQSLLPTFRAFMEKIVSDNAYSSVPLLRILFAPAFYWWLLYFYVVAVFYRKSDREVLPAVFLVVYYLTLLLSPTVLVRYMYPLMVTVPVILSCLTANNKKKG